MVLGNLFNTEYLEIGGLNLSRLKSLWCQFQLYANDLFGFFLRHAPKLPFPLLSVNTGLTCVPSPVCSLCVTRQPHQYDCCKIFTIINSLTLEALPVLGDLILTPHKQLLPS